MPFFAQILLALKGIIGFSKVHWKILVPLVIFILGYSWWVGFEKGKGKEDRQIKACNEEVLKDQLESEKKLREDAEKLNLDLQTRVTRLAKQNHEQNEYMKELELYLSVSNLPDDQVSARTREFVRQLNQRTGELVEEERLENEK